MHATSSQATFACERIAGTLVGFWTPAHARTINVPGYHLHLLSDDHQHAGHVLALTARELQVELLLESHLQLVLPDTAALAQAEGDHPLGPPAMVSISSAGLTAGAASLG